MSSLFSQNIFSRSPSLTESCPRCYIPYFSLVSSCRLSPVGRALLGSLFYRWNPISRLPVEPDTLTSWPMTSNSDVAAGQPRTGFLWVVVGFFWFCFVFSPGGVQTTFRSCFLCPPCWGLACGSHHCAGRVPQASQPVSSQRILSLPPISLRSTRSQMYSITCSFGLQGTKLRSSGLYDKNFYPSPQPPGQILRLHIHFI